MSDFRKLSESVYASPQIGLAEVEQAARMGVRLIVNNRPEDEASDQTPGPEIERAAREAGMDYVAIPVTHAGFSMPQVEALRAALDRAGDSPVLAYCRSGTRSTLLWALAEAKAGRNPAALSAAAAQAGYDLTPIAGILSALSAEAR